MKHNIVESLVPLAADLSSVNLDPNNARTGHDLRRLSNSLTQYGQRKPIVVNKNGNVILAGNGTWTAAKSLGWTHIAVVWVSDDEETATGYAIADNRIGELSEWDLTQLSSSLEVLSESEEEYEVGFDSASINMLFAQIGDEQLPASDFEDDMKQFDDDESGFKQEQADNGKSLVLNLTVEQYEIVIEAIEQKKMEIAINDGSEAMYHICNDYLGD
jgi:ParB-like chromosome segregation protein Spo0J